MYEFFAAVLDGVSRLVRHVEQRVVIAAKMLGERDAHAYANIKPVKRFCKAVENTLDLRFGIAVVLHENYIFVAAHARAHVGRTGVVFHSVGYRF